MDLNSYAQIIKNEEPIFAVYREPKKHYSLKVLFYGIKKEDGSLTPLVFDSEFGLVSANSFPDLTRFHHGAVEDIASY